MISFMSLNYCLDEYCIRALLGASACISTRRKWVPNKELAPTNKGRAYVSYIGVTTFTINFFVIQAAGQLVMPNNE